MKPSKFRHLIPGYLSDLEKKAKHDINGVLYNFNIITEDECKRIIAGGSKHVMVDAKVKKDSAKVSNK